MLSRSLHSLQAANFRGSVGQQLHTDWRLFWPQPTISVGSGISETVSAGRSQYARSWSMD